MGAAGNVATNVGTGGAGTGAGAPAAGAGGGTSGGTATGGADTGGTVTGAPSGAPAGAAPSGTPASRPAGAGESQGVGAAAPAAPTASGIDPKSFGWGTWDGSLEALPEPARGWAEPLSSHYKKQLDAKTEELSDWNRWFGDLGSTGSDDGKVQGLTQQIADLQKRYGDLEAKHAAYEKEVSAREAAVSTAYTERFLAAHRETLAKPGVAEAFGKLIAENVDIHAEVAIKLVHRGLETGDLAGVVTAASRMKGDGVPDSYIERLVLGAGAPKKEPPRVPEASPTAGFEGAAGASLSRGPSGGDNHLSLDGLVDRFRARASELRG